MKVEVVTLTDEPDGSDRTPNKVCDLCGREQRRINIVYVSGRAGDH